MIKVLNLFVETTTSVSNFHILDGYWGYFVWKIQGISQLVALKNDDLLKVCLLLNSNIYNSTDIGSMIRR